MTALNAIASVVPITAGPSLGEAADGFLARRDIDDDTVRSYAQTMTRLRRELGDATALASVGPAVTLGFRWQGILPAIWQVTALDRADDEGLAGGLDDFLGDGADLVDFQDAVDLGHELAGKAEVSAGDAVDGGDGLSGGVVVGIVQVQVRPLPGEGECPVQRLQQPDKFRYPCRR